MAPGPNTPPRSSPESQPSNLGTLFSPSGAPKLSRVVPGSAGRCRDEGAGCPVLCSRAVPAELRGDSPSLQPEGGLSSGYRALLGTQVSSAISMKVTLLLALLGLIWTLAFCPQSWFLNYDPFSTIFCSSCHATRHRSAPAPGHKGCKRLQRKVDVCQERDSVPPALPSCLQQLPWRQEVLRAGGDLRYPSVRWLGSLSRSGSPCIAPRLFTAHPAASSALPGVTLPTAAPRGRHGGSGASARRGLWAAERSEEGARALCGDTLAGSPSAAIQTSHCPFCGILPGSGHILPSVPPGGARVPPAWPFGLRRL